MQRAQYGKGGKKRVTLQLKDLTNTTSRMMLKVHSAGISHLDSYVRFFDMILYCCSLPPPNAWLQCNHKENIRQMLIERYFTKWGNNTQHCHGHLKQGKSLLLWVQHFRLRHAHVKQSHHVVYLIKLGIKETTWA